MPSRRKIRKVQPELHRPPTHLPRCPVEGKLCFPDEPAAAKELFECRMLLLFHNKKRRKETRSYVCDHCGAYHLTAMKVPPSHVGAAHGNGVQMAPSGRKKPRPTGGGGGAGGGGGDGWGGDTGGGDCGGGE